MNKRVEREKRREERGEWRKVRGKRREESEARPQSGLVSCVLTLFSPLPPLSSLLSFLSSLLLPLFLISCGESEFEYSNHRAYCVFDNSQHLDATLSSAMNAMSPGIFCRISISSETYIDFENNQGLKSRVALNAIERQRLFELGVYNGSGVIVGYGTFDNPPVFFGYDAQCPNCYEESNMPRYQLSISSDGKAACKNCHRQYDMNNGGIIVSGSNGDKLIRYHASTTGPMGVLTVNN